MRSDVLKGAVPILDASPARLASGIICSILRIFVDFVPVFVLVHQTRPSVPYRELYVLGQSALGLQHGFVDLQ